MKFLPRSHTHIYREIPDGAYCQFQGELWGYDVGGLPVEPKKLALTRPGEIEENVALVPEGLQGMVAGEGGTGVQ